ncbi:hypothetical protein BCY75_05795 [Latilactobacillus curvatus]|nr:hypothetical protein BCY75_05795 [Latilactobacillus curvatus]
MAGVLYYNYEVNNLEYIKDSSRLSWKDAYNIMERDYICGYCGSHTSSVMGLKLTESYIRQGYSSKSYRQSGKNGIYICTHCQLPSFFWDDVQIPGYKFGDEVKGISDKLAQLYNEARDCYSVNAYTGVVLLCRKLLMNISIELGAEPNKRFIEYVNYLDDNNYISANSRGWVDKIRKVGNEATHEAEIKSKEDATNLIKFCEMIMKMNFEYPSLIEE